MSSIIERETVKASVDLADLFTVSINSKQLELVLSSILSRLSDVEGLNNNNNNKVNGDGAKENGGNSNNNNKDWEDAINQLRTDLDKERERSDNQQSAINELEDAHEKAADEIRKLHDQADALEEKKADKKKNNKNGADENEENSDALLNALKKKVGELEDQNNALAARVATLEGLAAASNPNAAKEQGLSSFTDTLNDVLKQAKDLENRLTNAESAIRDTDVNDDDILERIGVLEKINKQQEQDEAAGKDDQQKAGGSGGPANFATKDDLKDLKTDLLARIPTSSSLLDGVLADLETLKRNIKDLEKKQQQQPVGSASNNNITQNNNNNSGGGDNDLSDLERRVEALEGIAEALRKGLTDHKNETHKKFDTLTADVEDVKDLLGNAVKEIKALGQECSRNTADCKLLHDKKADKGAAGAAAAAAPSSPVTSADVNNNNNKSLANDSNNNGGQQQQQIANLGKLLENLETRVSGLSQDKASKDAVGQITRDVGDLKSNLKNLQNAIDSILNNNNGLQLAGMGAGGSGGFSSLSGAGAGGGAASDASLQNDKETVGELQKRLAELESWAKGQLVEIRATVDHIHHAKADAAIVANKAERDYVENAMEKLMHEVENVLNATNAGLIDTLDKSLNILRDMIDGKATKQDINKLQGMMGQQQQQSGGGSGEVPDGLASFKSYRCLGCNRTMETMRPRPMGSTMNAFTNRVPAATGRNAPASSQGLRPATLIQQQQQHAALPAPPSTPPTVGGSGAGYITNAASK